MTEPNTSPDRFTAMPSKARAPKAKPAIARAERRNRLSTDEKLLAGMEKLLAQGENFSTVSIERLTESAGISRATFYLYFGDKGELVTHLVEQVKDEIVKSAGIWFQDASFVSRADMQQTLRGIIGVYRKHHVILAAMAQTASGNAEVARLSREMRTNLCWESRRAVSRLRSAGRAHPDASDLVADLLTLAIDLYSTAHAEMLQGKNFERVVAGWTHIAWNALAAPQPDRASSSEAADLLFTRANP